jgi:hypothetical protein
MGLFKPKNPPNTISDDDWAKIQRGANKTEARQDGMVSKKAVDRRKTYSRQLKKRHQS